MADSFKETLKKIPPSAWAIMGGVVLVVLLAAKKGGGGDSVATVPVYPQMGGGGDGGTASGVGEAMDNMSAAIGAALGAQTKATQDALAAQAAANEANQSYLAGLIEASGRNDPSTEQSPGGGSQTTPVAGSVNQMNTTPNALQIGLSQLKTLGSRWYAVGGEKDTADSQMVHEQANQVRSWMLSQGVNPAEVPRQYWGSNQTSFEVG